MKLNSNLYSFDAILFLALVRIYSGHGTEREQIRVSAMEFKLQESMCLAKLELYLNEFINQWRSVEKYCIVPGGRGQRYGLLEKL